MGPPPSVLDPYTGYILIPTNGQAWMFVTVAGVLTRYQGNDTMLATPQASDAATAGATSPLYISDGPRIHALFRT